MEQESALAEHVICASSFTKHSLVSCGVAEDKIDVVPYGVDLQIFKPGRPSADRPLTFLYVARKSPAKSLECY